MVCLLALVLAFLSPPQPGDSQQGWNTFLSRKCSSPVYAGSLGSAVFPWDQVSVVLDSAPAPGTSPVSSPGPVPCDTWNGWRAGSIGCPLRWT